MPCARLRASQRIYVFAKPGEKERERELGFRRTIAYTYVTREGEPIAYKKRAYIPRSNFPVYFMLWPREERSPSKGS